MTPERPHHRPALFADLTELIDAGGGMSPQRRSELAAATAEAVVRAGRDRGRAQDPSTFVDLADRVGLDTLAELWREADPASLPGALWTLYLLRQWCRTSPEEVARLWRAGEALAAVDAVVAGVPDFADADSVRELADSVLRGVYSGDLGVALERAAAFFRVVAVGRRALAGEGDPAAAVWAERNERAAAALGAVARTVVSDGGAVDGGAVDGGAGDGGVGDGGAGDGGAGDGGAAVG